MRKSPEAPAGMQNVPYLPLPGPHISPCPAGVLVPPGDAGANCGVGTNELMPTLSRFRQHLLVPNDMPAQGAG